MSTSDRPTAGGSTPRHSPAEEAAPAALSLPHEERLAYARQLLARGSAALDSAAPKPSARASRPQRASAAETAAPLGETLSAGNPPDPDNAAGSTGVSGDAGAAGAVGVSGDAGAAGSARVDGGALAAGSTGAGGAAARKTGAGGAVARKTGAARGSAARGRRDVMPSEKLADADADADAAGAGDGDAGVRAGGRQAAGRTVDPWGDLDDDFAGDDPESTKRRSTGIRRSESADYWAEAKAFAGTEESGTAASVLEQPTRFDPWADDTPASTSDLPGAQSPAASSTAGPSSTEPKANSAQAARNPAADVWGTDSPAEPAGPAAPQHRTSNTSSAAASTVDAEVDASAPEAVEVPAVRRGRGGAAARASRDAVVDASASEAAVADAVPVVRRGRGGVAARLSRDAVGDVSAPEAVEVPAVRRGRGGAAARASREAVGDVWG
ncbi:hypothetical protein ACFCV3_20805, partial [Kribbella sp. NPDC056345]